MKSGRLAYSVANPASKQAVSFFCLSFFVTSTSKKKPCSSLDNPLFQVSNVMEQMLWYLHEEDVDFINADGRTMNKLLLEANPHVTLFTGSSQVAKRLAVDLKGRVKSEDVGFNWKILVEPDVEEVLNFKLLHFVIPICKEPEFWHRFGFVLLVSKWKVDYVSWVCDQDAYACSG